MLGDVGDFIVPSAEPLINSLIELQMNNTTTSAPIFAKQVLPAVLRLTLTKKWYDMILSGEKKEEYRELKDYWEQRLMNFDIVSRNSFSSFKKPVGFKHFDFVEFRNGYAKTAPTMLVECKGIRIGKARPEWSEGFADDCFVISLGSVVKLGA